MCKAPGSQMIQKNRQGIHASDSAWRHQAMKGCNKEKARTLIFTNKGLDNSLLFRLKKLVRISVLYSRWNATC